MHALFSALLLTLVLAGCEPDTARPDDAPAARLPATETVLPEPATNLGAAPDFTISRLGGGDLSLADYQDRVVLVNFWATWCAPCIEEIPDLIALHDEYNEAGLTVLGIAIDAEGFEVVAPFAEEHGIDYAVGIDDGAVAEAFGGVLGLPTTFVIDRNGQIARRVLGLYRIERERPILEDLLAARP